MASCPQCNASLPEGMRFCLQCGAPLRETPTPEPPAPADAHLVQGDPPFAGPQPELSAPAPVRCAAPTSAQPPSRHKVRTALAAAEDESDGVSVRQNPRRQPPATAEKPRVSPMAAPRSTPLDGRVPPNFRLEIPELDNEDLKRSFQKPTQPGVIVCRFCKSPLDLDSDFCDQCGAPVLEAAPPGTVLPKRPAVEPQPPAPSTSQRAGTAPKQAARTSKVAVPPLGRPEPALGKPAAADPAPATNVPSPPAKSSAGPSGGLLGRFKGLFKKS